VITQLHSEGATGNDSPSAGATALSMIFRAVPFWNKRNSQATDSAVTGSASQLMLGLREK